MQAVFKAFPLTGFGTAPITASSVGNGLLAIYTVPAEHHLRKARAPERCTITTSGKENL